MLKPGLYEQVINAWLAAKLDQVTDLAVQQTTIDGAEASDVLARYVMAVMKEALDLASEKQGGLTAQIELANQVIQRIQEASGDQAFAGRAVQAPGELLLALAQSRTPARPETSLSRSTLLTGSEKDPQLYSELKEEIKSSDRIDFLVSFIKWSGIRMIMEELREHVQRGGRLRVITTSYMGASDYKAIAELSKLPNTEVRISYDTERTRLHAKAYIFYRNTGYHVAYIGSSNLSRPAISSGLEWNIKITDQDQPEPMAKIRATFDGYWEAKSFERFDDSQAERLRQALGKGNSGSSQRIHYLFDLAPYPFQQEILDQLDAERMVRGHTRNLIVAATGTGKTVISAFDYKRFRQQHPERPRRLLFVAHRQEILEQSLACYRTVLRDPNFGELYVGEHVPEQSQHLFMSIQTFNARAWTTLTDRDYYDYIVVDEFHHAAAPSYQDLLTYYEPEILLGLTATPERLDGKSVLGYFDDRIAAEIRLPEAINRRLLSPFHYFGVADDVDLSTLRWTRGGYDRGELEKIYALDTAVAQKRASLILQAVERYVTDLDEVKGLGFCVSVAHAQFMAQSFNLHGLPSLALHADSPREDRKTARAKLIAGELRFIFVVDLYNEGVDIPEVNTILFLRPTESLTVFLQQLGRGLRLAEGKECLTVLDFIGQAHQRYNFEEKYAALLNHTHRGVTHELKKGFVSLPRGSYIKLERQAEQAILNNISQSFDNVRGLTQKLADHAEDLAGEVTLRSFLDYYHLDPRRIYKGYSFARLCARAGLREAYDDPQEDTITKGLRKVCDIDSQGWIRFLIDLFESLDSFEARVFTEQEQRMLTMFQYTMWPRRLAEHGHGDLASALRSLRDSRYYAEFRELLDYNLEHIDFVDQPLLTNDPTPLALHCRYTMDQLLAAWGQQPRAQQAGVYYDRANLCDLFFVTLNKSDKDYSANTMYEDYSINEELFHWQSQYMTAEDSETGQRYIHHRKTGNRILFFVREYRQEHGATAPYTLLGFADYVSHEGSRPMSITWRLHEAIPAKFLKSTDKLAVG